VDVHNDGKRLKPISMFNDLWFRLRLLWRGRRSDRELDDELQRHLEHETQKLMASGLDAAEARRRAIVRFGALERVKEECRDARGIAAVTTIAQDASYAIRQFRRSPGLAVVAIVTLGLGVGANTAMFQLLNAVRLKTLPVPRPQELVEIRIAGGNQGMGVNAGRYGVLTRPLWEEVRRDHPALSGVFAWSTNIIRVGPNSDRTLDALARTPIADKKTSRPEKPPVIKRIEVRAVTSRENPYRVLQAPAKADTTAAPAPAPAAAGSR